MRVGGAASGAAILEMFAGRFSSGGDLGSAVEGGAAGGLLVAALQLELARGSADGRRECKENSSE